jgi:mono/diheme cytochrome c family protein
VVTQVAQGQALFLANCARCHGDQGQGNIGPPLIGERHGLRGYATAQGLFDYVSRTMPFDAAGSLPEQTYWDILAFILTNDGYLPEGTVLGPENADEIDISD